MLDYWVFGCEGSGTTWLARMLDQCPRLQCLNETRIPLVLQAVEQALARTLADPALHRNNPADPTAPIRQSSELPRYVGPVLRGWADAAYGELRRPGTRWLGDKHPYYREIAPFLAALYPRARRIGIWRSAEATVASNHRRFGTPVGCGIEAWKRYARFLIDSIPGELLLEYEAVQREGPGSLCRLVSRLTGEDGPARWDPLMPQGSGVPVCEVLTPQDRLLIASDPEIGELTKRLCRASDTQVF